MEESDNNRNYLGLFIRRLLSLRDDKAPEDETVASIKAGVEFRGARLWILIFAIFIASLGLNTNSAAVIIGAMLISPLMGPIMGMGLGVGINDFELLKRSFRSFAVATIFSVLTATFYFAITPIDEAQSELLARTSPTIYDVLIALFGGLAGIVALSSTGQRGGNVIPGVAIATAIMPPLCTTGFGIATGNWLYSAGAFYLYLINSIFISLATFIGVNIFHFKKKVFVDKQREKRVKHIIITIAVLTMLPSALLTYMLVREDMFTNKANNFIADVVSSDHTQVISKDVDYRKKRNTPRDHRRRNPRPGTLPDAKPAGGLRTGRHQAVCRAGHKEPDGRTTENHARRNQRAAGGQEPRSCWPTRNCAPTSWHRNSPPTGKRNRRQRPWAGDGRALPRSRAGQHLAHRVVRRGRQPEGRLRDARLPLAEEEGRRGHTAKRC